ncbi:MAG TPA: flagellin [Rhizomicrobium sp.]|jgi:flagellar hook-associated protein 3 FlgL|nr:flagellin [Rhizomicrobium sp.]
MTIDRVGTNAQTQIFLAQIMKANNALTTSEQQVASGKVSDTYGGYGDKTALLEATRSAANRATAYQSATTQALNQADLQDSQLSSLSDLANSLRQAVTKAVADGDGSTLMTQAEGIYEQVTQILNTKDANGNYLYGGDKNTTPPVTANTLSDLAALPNAAAAFANGTITNSVQVADGQSQNVGLLASDIGSQLMQTFQDIANFNNGSTGNFGSTLTDAQSTFLSGQIQNVTDDATGINNTAAQNGYTYSALQAASDQQTALNTTYTGFLSSLENVDMGQAVEQLNQNQVALQASLQVTSGLNQLSLLNYLPTTSS